MSITSEDVIPEDIQNAGNALAQGISQASHGLEYATMLYAFGKLVAMMSRRSEAGDVPELVEVIRVVAQATIDEFGELEDGSDL